MPDADSAQQQPLRLGELLVEQGAITTQQLRHALDVQAATHRPLGDLLERLYGLDAIHVNTAWAQQYVAVNGEQDLTGADVDQACIELLKPRQAWQFRVVPMRFDKLPCDSIEPPHLTIATTRRGLRKAMNFAARTFRVPPAVVVATSGSMRVLLERHYPVAPHIADWAFDR
ncbi:MAG: hypothetical protein AAGI46_16580 [Planctomycetota bacterium]